MWEILLSKFKQITRFWDFLLGVNGSWASNSFLMNCSRDSQDFNCFRLQFSRDPILPEVATLCDSFVLLCKQEKPYLRLFMVRVIKDHWCNIWAFGLSFNLPWGKAFWDFSEAAPSPSFSFSFGVHFSLVAGEHDFLFTMSYLTFSFIAFRTSFRLTNLAL